MAATTIETGQEFCKEKVEMEGTQAAQEVLGKDSSRDATPDRVILDGCLGEDAEALREGSPVSESSGTDECSLPVVETSSAAVGSKAKDSGGKSKSKKKEDKGIEHVLRALSSLDTTEEKLAALCKKYTDILEEHRLLQNKFRQGQRKLATISREKEQLQSEHSKAILAKSKLESLCRELQKHNKLVKEESIARAKEEEEKRKEVTAKFQTTITDIQKQMNEHYEKNTKLREENVDLANKLKSLIEQYELREEHIEKVFKHKDLEQQLVDAKLAQSNLQMSEEKQKNLEEKQVLLTEAQNAQAKIDLLQEQEKQLRTQVALYTDKYEEFQQTLGKSNEVFQSFKTEMDKMTKKIKKLEKETTMWRQRWENSNKALLEMAEDKTKNDKETTRLQSKVQKLESLCRALQEERKKRIPTVNQTPVMENGTESQGGGGLGVPEIKDIAPTKTPPNTPEGSQSRASPATVQPEPNGPQLPSQSQIANDCQSEPAVQQPDQSADTTQHQDSHNGSPSAPGEEGGGVKSKVKLPGSPVLEVDEAESQRTESKAETSNEDNNIKAEQ